MSTIFVDTDNSSSDRKMKLFDGARAGGAALKVEETMQNVVKRVVDKAPGFTTTKSAKAKGYRIRLSVASVEVSGGDTKCKLSGSIVRYPPTATASRGQGEAMVSTSMSGSATASGKSDYAILDCVEAVAEQLVTKSLPAMRADFARR